MRAAVLYAPGDLRLIDIPKPSPGVGEVLLRIEEVGICASDVHWFRDGRIGDQLLEKPTILGHEFSAVVAEVGPGVKRVKVGDRVAVEPANWCFQCDMCASEDFNLCRNIKFAGTSPIDGAFREFAVWPEHFMEKIPDHMTLGEAAMLEPLGVGMYAVDLAGDIRGKDVVILGSGAVGLSVLQCALSAGAGKVYVTDLIDTRLELARKLGADKTFDATDPDIMQSIILANGGNEPAVVFEAAGENDAVQMATELVRPGGNVVIIGIPYDDNMVVSAGTVRRKGLRLQMVRRSNKTLRRCVQLVSGGKADVASYITHRFPLDRISEAFQIAGERRDGAIRVLIQLTQPRHV
ncbi:MAG TPA: alcohol dehydrogenase catalytic domain-containing protein [Armatimonadota bacterium]|jgi:L-iditol 2-dehydrogenase